MAYVHSRYEVEMIPAQGPTAAGATAVMNGMDLGVTTIAAKWGPGLVPHIIRGAAIVMESPTTAFTGAAVGCRFEADISTAGTATHLFTISLPSSGANHKSIYHLPTYYVEIKPGSLVEVHATTAATVGVYAKAILYVEPRWEEPGNVTGMKKAT